MFLQQCYEEYPQFNAHSRTSLKQLSQNSSTGNNGGNTGGKKWRCPIHQTDAHSFQDCNTYKQMQAKLKQAERDGKQQNQRRRNGNDKGKDSDKNIICHYCKKPGHRQKDCRKRKADQQKSADVKNAQQQTSSDNKDKTCAYCKKKGHVARDCPKKKSDEAKKYGADGAPRRFQQSVQFASPEGENGSSSSDGFTIEYNINDIQEKKAPINFGQVIRQRMMRLVSKDKPPISADRRTRPMNTTSHQPLCNQSSQLQRITIAPPKRPGNFEYIMCISSRKEILRIIDEYIGDIRFRLMLVRGLDITEVTPLTFTAGLSGSTTRFQSNFD